MSIRRNIGGRYVHVREKSTSKGKKGTIMKNWKHPSKNQSRSKENYVKNYLKLIIISVLIIIAIGIWYFYFR